MSKTTSQFPNIYRIITELSIVKKLRKSRFGLIWKSKLKKPARILATILIFVFILLLVFGIVFYGIRFYRYVADSQRLISQRQNLQGQINFWQSVADKYEGYKDAYFQMAVLEYRLGNLAKAKEDNQKALLLDPNFEDAKSLEALLNKSN